MKKEKILIGGLLIMICIGLTIACEPPEPPVTPTPNYTQVNTTIPIDNNQNQSQGQNQNTTVVLNNQNDINNSQNQGQSQNTTVIVDNQIDNSNNQSNTLDIVFTPIINVFNYFNATNTANPIFTNNPVITIQSANGQLLDIALDQDTIQYGYNAQGQYQIMSQQIPFPSVLCKGAVTPYGTVLGVQEHNATTTGMQDTGFPLGALLAGGGLAGLGIIGAAKSGILARLGW